MKVLEFMSFNPGWFLTVPGILITAGVILLLIALILLLTSGKKEEEKVEEVAVPVNPVIEPQQPQTVEPVAVPQMPVENIEPTISIPTVEQSVAAKPVSEPVAEPSVAPVFETPNIPTVTPVEEIKEEPKIEIFEPTVESPTVIPVVDFEAPVSNVISEVEEVKVEQVEVKPAVSIYGGVSPVKDIFSQPEQPKVIYGGADPLENTAPIPKVEIAPTVPSVADVTPIMEPATPEIPVTQTAVMDNSVTATIPAAPTLSFEDIEPAKPVMSEVAPVSALFETPAAPVSESVPEASVISNSVKEEVETLDF